MVSFWRSMSIRMFKGIHLSNRKKLIFGKDVSVERFVTIKGGGSGNSVLKIGDNTWVREGAYLSANRGILIIGENCLIAHRAWLGGHGQIEISNNVLIGPNAVIVSSNHDLMHSGKPATSLPEVEGTIQVGENSWIGANSVILPDVDIGKECIVGAGSVVTRSIADGICVAGNPAEPISDSGLKLSI